MSTETLTWRGLELRYVDPQTWRYQDDAGLLVEVSRWSAEIWAACIIVGRFESIGSDSRGAVEALECALADLREDLAKHNNLIRDTFK